MKLHNIFPQETAECNDDLQKKASKDDLKAKTTITFIISPLVLVCGHICRIAHIKLFFACPIVQMCPPSANRVPMSYPGKQPPENGGQKESGVSWEKEVEDKKPRG